MAGAAGLAGLPEASPAGNPLTLKLGLIEGLSGPFANAGEAVERNFVFAIERINARGLRVGDRR